MGIECLERRASTQGCLSSPVELSIMAGTGYMLPFYRTGHSIFPCEWLPDEAFNSSTTSLSHPLSSRNRLYRGGGCCFSVPQLVVSQVAMEPLTTVLVQE